MNDVNAAIGGKEDTEVLGLTSTIVHTLCVGGNANVSTPVKCKIRKPGNSSTMLKRPTKPKNKGRLIFLSSPILFFMTVV